MKIIKTLFIAGLLLSATAHAEQASEKTVRQLMEVTNSRQLLESVKAQLNTIMNNSVQQALRGHKPTPQQQQAIARMQNKTVALLQSEFSWEKFEPMYLRLYRESFTEEEAAGMLAFYKTPAGQAVIKKMPVLMQKTMLETQKLMAGLTPELRKIQEDFAADMKALDKPAP